MGLGSKEFLKIKRHFFPSVSPLRAGRAAWGCSHCPRLGPWDCKHCTNLCKSCSRLHHCITAMSCGRIFHNSTFNSAVTPCSGCLRWLLQGVHEQELSRGWSRQKILIWVVKEGFVLWGCAGTCSGPTVSSEFQDCPISFSASP